MSEAGFTKGPWTLVRNDEDDCWRVFGTSPMGREGCYSVGDVNDGNGTPQNRANADLITASPDLYDAAENALNALIGCCVPAGGVDDRKTILEAQAMLRAALAKAEGKKE